MASSQLAIEPPSVPLQEDPTSLQDPNPSDASAAATDAAEQLPPTSDAVTDTTPATPPKWPGWTGDNVFRLIVPVLKVGSIIGRKGELVKKMCEETRARIRILEGPIGTTDRIVLISGKEELDSELSPAMDAVLRVFKRVAGLTSSESDTTASAAGVAAFCSIRLLVASSQAIHLIGKQGSTIKSIQENSSATVRVLSEGEVPSYATSDERIVEIHGDAMKVLKALNAVLGQLRKFRVDHSVVPIFEKTYNATISQDRSTEPLAAKTQTLLHPGSASAPTQPGIGATDFSLSMKRDPFLFDLESHLDSKLSRSGVSLYGQDPGLSTLGSNTLGRKAAPIVTQMDGSLSGELYSETLGLLNSKLTSVAMTDSPRNDSQAFLTNGDEDGSLWGDFLEEADGTSDLDREWQSRYSQFYMIGYRDGLMVGKEASAQEGFNIGFGESVLIGFSWGVIRGVISTLGCIPDGLKDRLVETQEKRNRFQQLNDSIHALSTEDGLKLFHVNMLKKGSSSDQKKQNIEIKTVRKADLEGGNPKSKLLGNFYEEFRLLIADSPTIKVHLDKDQ